MITLHLKRTKLEKNYTIGELWDSNGTDPKFLCYSLEDEVREVEDKPVEYWKIAGLTAIPKGLYQVKCTYSVRFKKNTLQLINVPGFSGIRIHSGNRADDTEGCILLGMKQEGNAVLSSREAVKKLENWLFPLLDKGEIVKIAIS